jgi:hypothetical protein
MFVSPARRLVQIVSSPPHGRSIHPILYEFLIGSGGDQVLGTSKIYDQVP